MTVKIRHRVNEPSGVVAQLLEGDDVVEERKLDEADPHEGKLLRDATALTAAGDDVGMIRLLFPDHLPQR